VIVRVDGSGGQRQFRVAPNQLDGARILHPDRLGQEAVFLAFDEQEPSIGLSQVNACQLGIVVKLRQEVPLEPLGVLRLEHALFDQLPRQLRRPFGGCEETAGVFGGVVAQVLHHDARVLARARA
jgi:hypothetical protein